MYAAVLMPMRYERAARGQAENRRSDEYFTRQEQTCLTLAPNQHASCTPAIDVFLRKADSSLNLVDFGG